MQEHGKELVDALLRLGDEGERSEWFAVTTYAQLHKEVALLQLFDEVEVHAVVLHWVPEVSTYILGVPLNLLAVCGAMKVGVRGNNVDSLSDKAWDVVEVCTGCAETWESLRG